MARNMQINRLDKEELTYELTIRGIATGNVDGMRRQLSQALQLEKEGCSMKYPSYPFTFDQDYTEVKKKLERIAEMVEPFNNGRGSNEALKLQTKFSYVLGRLDNMVIDTEEEGKKKSEMVAQVLMLMDEFNVKIERFEERRQVIVPPVLGFIERNEGASAIQDGLASTSHSTPVNNVGQRINNPSEAGGKTLAPHKWNVQKFSGDKKTGVSINAFLERIEELRVARNVSKDTLLNSGIDLFSDKAYQFYKDCRGRVTTWEELVVEFREEYLSSSYEDDLFEELQKRTLHPSESIGVYLAVMSSYFNRLRCSISEEAKLKIILRNLHPFYLERLSDPMPTSIPELRTACRSMEARRDMIKNYVEPSPRRSIFLERDLACVEITEHTDAIESTSRGETAVAVKKKNISCFRCGQLGHKAIGCVSPKKLVCFKCQTEGYTVRSCPNCNKKGNGDRRT